MSRTLEQYTAEIKIRCLEVSEGAVMATLAKKLVELDLANEKIASLSSELEAFRK